MRPRGPLAAAGAGAGPVSPRLEPCSPCSRGAALERSRREVRLAPARSMFVDDPAPHDSYVNEDVEFALKSRYTDGTTVFSADRWKSHKTTGRYWRHLSGLFQSRTAKNLSKPLLTLATSSTLMCLYEQLAQDHVLPPWLPPVSITHFPFEQTSFALSLLLVFRTDSSYSRYVEALEMWREVGCCSREMVVDTLSIVRDTSAQKMVVRWIVTFSKSLELYVTGRAPELKKLCAYLKPAEAERLLCARCSPPLFCLQVLTLAVLELKLSEVRENKMMQAIGKLNFMIGKAEELLSHPIPLAYTRHTSRFMLLWLGCLPLALFDDLGWITIGVNVVMAYVLLGIEEIGVQIEEPFSRLPVSEITKGLTREIHSIVESMEDAKELVEGQFQAQHDAYPPHESSSKQTNSSGLRGHS